MEIIDTHAYLGRNETLGFCYSIDNLLEAKNMYKDNLRFIVVAASPQTNKVIANLAREHQEFILGAYLQVQPREELRYSYTSPKEIASLSRSPEIKGLKLVTSLVNTSINSSLLTPYIEIAEENSLAFLIHCSATGTEYTSFDKIKEVAEKHPDLKLILAHFGGLNLNYTKGSMLLARAHPNIYLNTAGLSGEIKRYESRNGVTPYVREWYTNLELRHCWSHVLQDSMSDSVLSKKILFGTDYPILAHQLYPLDKLASADQQKIMDNARKLFKC